MAQFQVLRYSARSQTRLGMHFVPFPCPSSSGDQALGEFTVPGGPCLLITSLDLATQFPGCAARAPSHVCCESTLGSLSLAATLLADVNHPGSSEAWLATGSLLTVWWKMPVPGIEIASCLPVLAVTCLPLCLQRWGEDCIHQASSPLVLAQYFVL